MTKITQKYLREKIKENEIAKQSFITGKHLDGTPIEDHDPCFASMGSLMLVGKTLVLKELLDYMKKKPKNLETTDLIERA